MKVILDTDFLNELLDRKPEDKPIEFFKQMMTELGYEPMVVSYVAKKELEHNNCAQQLISEGIIHVLDYEEFLTEDAQKGFEEKAWMLAEEMADEVFTRPSISIFDSSFRLMGKNFGEILSELAAHELGVSYFASNDKGAKSLAIKHFNRLDYRLKVYNIAEVLNQLDPTSSKFKWKDLKHILKDSRWEKEKELLRKKWLISRR